MHQIRTILQYSAVVLLYKYSDFTGPAYIQIVLRGYKLWFYSCQSSVEVRVIFCTVNSIYCFGLVIHVAKKLLEQVRLPLALLLAPLGQRLERRPAHAKGLPEHRVAQVRLSASGVHALGQ